MCYESGAVPKLDANSTPQSRICLKTQLVHLEGGDVWVIGLASMRIHLKGRDHLNLRSLGLRGETRHSLLYHHFSSSGIVF